MSLFASLVWVPSLVLTHGVAMGSLTLDQVEPNRFVTSWQTDKPGVTASPVYPPECVSEVAGAVTAVTCDLRGQTLAFATPSGPVDVLIRVRWLDGREESHVSAAGEAVKLGGAPSASFLRLGVEHIVGGPDHVLFVVGLMLLLSGWRRRLMAITTFTLAHSITLASSALGIVTLPPAPVEVIIALSLVWLAREIVRPTPSRAVLGVTFAFGLLHGLGFAGALAEVGLPAESTGWALLTFNIGVELGQLGIALATLALVHAVAVLVPRRISLRPAAAYGVGTLAAMWTLQRITELGL